jgi:iron complex transport system ATP-binding protein
MLQLQNLSTGFAKKSVTLHQNISMRVDAGNLVLLLGPNGIGKSVLLKTVAGLQAPLSGEVSVNQINIHHTTPEIRASLSSILLATPPAIEQMKVSEIVLSGRQRFITGWKNPAQSDLTAVENAMRKTGIHDLKNASFGALSDGVKQKVMLARCLAQDSQLILLDEPLAFLDYPSRINFLQLLSHLTKTEAKTIIYSSHDLQLSINHCDHIIAITQNQCDFYQNPKELILTDIFPVQ